MATTFLLVFITWLALTYSLSLESLLIGFAVSFVITFISRHLLSPETPRIFFHPMRWLGFLAYMAYMVYAEALAHLDVIKRIFTGRIRPAIVSVQVGFDTHLGKTLLGNSITLTPGTLTVNVERKRTFFVHAIAYRKGMDIGRGFTRFGKRVIG